MSRNRKSTTSNEGFFPPLDEILNSYRPKIKQEDIKDSSFPIVGQRLRVSTPICVLFEEFFNKLPSNKGIMEEFGISDLRMFQSDGVPSKSIDISSLYPKVSNIMFTFNDNTISMNFSIYIDSQERVNVLTISTEKETKLSTDGIFKLIIKWALSISNMKGKPIEFYGFENGWRMLDKVPTKTYDDIHLPEHQMNDIKMYMNVFDKSSKLLRYLFVGIPGTAKTESMLLLTNEATKRGITTIKTSLDIDRSQLAEFAKFVSPCVVLFDDVDTYIGSRERGFDPARLRNFLDFLDGVEKLPDNVGMVATTNSSKMLDIAAQRPGRFHKTVYFDSITKENIKSIIVKALRDEFSQSTSKQIVKEYTHDSIVSTLYDHKKTGSYVYNFVKMSYLKWESNNNAPNQIKHKFLVDELNSEIEQGEKMKKAKVLTDVFANENENREIGFVDKENY
jgi:hypothetical protein